MSDDLDTIQAEAERDDAGMWFLAAVLLGLPLGIGVAIGVLIMTVFA